MNKTERERKKQRESRNAHGKSSYKQVMIKGNNIIYKDTQILIKSTHCVCVVIYVKGLNPSTTETAHYHSTVLHFYTFPLVAGTFCLKAGALVLLILVLRLGFLRDRGLE